MEKAQIWGDIIHGDGNVEFLLSDIDGLEGEDYGFGDRTMEEEGHYHDGFSDYRIPEEGDHDDGSGDRTEEGAIEKSGSIQTSVRRRCPNKRLGRDERFTIEVLARDGQPIAPKRTKDTFVH